MALSSKARQCKTTWPLKLNTLCFLKMLVTTHLTTQHYIPENFKPLSRRTCSLWCSKNHSVVAGMSCDIHHVLVALQGHEKTWLACCEGGPTRCMKNLNKARSFKQNSENL